MVLALVGYIALAEAALLLLPSLVGLIYAETEGWAFLITAAISAALGLALVFLCRTKDRTIYAREGFAVVALGWLVMSALGALPYVINGDIPNYIDAFFETVSGFTTTGASIVTDIDALSHATLFWRSFAHFIGGMGVLIFVMAIIPNISDRSIHIMRAEMPGPVVGKLVPRARDTALILYVIYLALTATETLFLTLGGTPFFESMLLSFGTAGTGGLGVNGVGIVKPYDQWVIAVFMMLFGVNFNLYYLILAKKFKAAVSSRELWVYFSIIATVTVAMFFIILPEYGVGDSVRHAFFQSVSIMTTTGYSTADFNLWPMLARGIIFILMFLGGCAGSTAGGLKLSRVILGFKTVAREFKRLLHPRSVSTVRFEGRPADEQTLNGVSTYFILYIVSIGATFLLLCFDKLGFTENITAAVSCINNIGPGLGTIGPASTYVGYSWFSKIVLSLAMLAGRLEFYPLILALVPSNWFGKKAY